MKTDHDQQQAAESFKAAVANAAEPTRDIPRMWTTVKNDYIREHYDPVSGETYTEIDWP